MADIKKDQAVTGEVAERLVAEAQTDGVELTGPGGLLTDLQRG